MIRIHHLTRPIIRCSFDLAIRCIELFSNMGPLNAHMDELRKLPKGTLGNDIARCLDAHQLRLVPRFESHDLKHVLLGYEMTPVDEVRMQAFMLGNRNYTLPCLAILFFGCLLLPLKWKVFFADFKNGRRTQPISALTIPEFSTHNSEELRREIMQEQPLVFRSGISETSRSSGSRIFVLKKQ